MKPIQGCATGPITVMLEPCLRLAACPCSEQSLQRTRRGALRQHDGSIAERLDLAAMAGEEKRRALTANCPDDPGALHGRKMAERLVKEQASVTRVERLGKMEPLH